MDVSLNRLAFYVGAAVAFFFAIGAASVNIIATLLFAAAGLVALPQVRSRLRARGTVITTWLAAALLVTGLASGLVVYSATPAADSTPNDAGAGTSTTASGVAISFSANDTEFQNDVDRLHVGWTAEAREVVDPQANDGYSYEADADRQYVVVRVNITNTGERSIDLTPRYFRLLANGVEYSPQQLAGGDDVRDVTLRPGASYKAHLTFEVPRDVDAATVIANPDAYRQKRVAAVFSEHTNLTVRYD